MNLLRVQDLSVRFTPPGGQAVEAVRHVSFEVGKGETVALVGESGSGKTVTALSVLGLLPYPLASHPTGSICFEEQELLNAPAAQLRRLRGSRIAMIFQEPMTALNPLHTIEKQISEPLFLHHHYTRVQARERVIELLKLVEFEEGIHRLDAYPHQLSGGQRQRVMIAMALACTPTLLIADEPTTALDVTIQASILRLLRTLKQQLEMSLLLITHDLGVVRKMADRVLVMKDGQGLDYGPTKQVLTQPQHKYTRHLIACEPQGTPPPLPLQAPVLLMAKDVQVHFGGRKRFLRPPFPLVRAVDGVSLSLCQGETLGIVGESGSGKSTLAYAILRLIRLSSGQITFNGQRLDGRKTHELRPLRQKLQIIFQDPFSSLNPRLSIGEIVGEGLSVHYARLSPAERQEKIIQALKDVHLDPTVYHRYPHEFSGGQRQRIAIARALVLQPAVLVLDEPTSALDRSIQAQTIDLLRSLQAQHQLSYLFISHDLKVVRAMSHRIMVMQKGRIVEEGETATLFAHPQKPYTKRLLQAALDVI